MGHLRIGSVVLPMDDSPAQPAFWSADFVTLEDPEGDRFDVAQLPSRPRPPRRRNDWDMARPLDRQW
jgi:hypothetical protein